MNASHLRWTELKRKGPWQAPSEGDSSEKLDIVIGDSVSPLPTAENDEDDSAADNRASEAGPRALRSYVKPDMNGQEKVSSKEGKYIT
jgi:hypothetical protein